ncbi:alpha/beta fold hydrolase [Plantibacter sp. Mn2098]|uniref:alpha/beta fold hydrolase n=1 Tax=Plantibacter sp. Mn2098 TaxID=3395266 RepID=UPI003BCE6ADC
MTTTAPSTRQRIETDGARLGLWRVVVPTRIGPVVARVGRERGGPATILLHGAAGSWTTWTPLLATADAAGTPLTDVVAVDLPGWGESPLPERRDEAGGQAEPPITVAMMSEAVEDVARALGYSEWHVIGHSLGGFIALDLAANTPEQTLSVDLVSGTGRAILDAVRHPFGGGVKLPWFAGMLLAMRTLSVLGPSARAVLRWLHGEGVLRWLASPVFASARAVDDSVVAALADEVRPASFVLACRAAAAYDERRWSRIVSPVRALHGDRDVFVGPGDGAAFAALIPDFAEVKVAGVGHFAAVERPEAVLAAVRAVW